MSAPRLDLGELKRLHEAATPGPWDLSMNENGDIMGVECTHYSYSTPGVCGNHSKRWPILNEDADLIAAMRNALPALLSIADAGAMEPKGVCSMTSPARYWGTKRAYNHAANVASICVGWTLGDALRGHSVLPLVVCIAAFAWNAAGYFCLDCEAPE